MELKHYPEWSAGLRVVANKIEKVWPQLAVQIRLLADGDSSVLPHIHEAVDCLGEFDLADEIRLAAIELGELK